MLTVPALARTMNVGVDALRVFLRRNPALASLAQSLGPTRYFDERGQEAIRSAWQARKQRATATA